MSFNINKHGVGQVNQITDHQGVVRTRQDKLLFMVNEMVQLIDVVYDPDHLAYQYRMPISKEEYNGYKARGVGIPLERQGPSVLCSCGCACVLIIDPKAPLEWQNKLLCQFVAQYGIHQTSFKIIDNKAIMPKNLEQDKIMSDSDLLKTLKDEEDNQ